jgi:uncharacterized protein (DUF1697 family)
MPSHVAFLRAVNIAPRWLKMEQARAALTEAGFTGVETYIQSGNVIVRSRMRSEARVAGRVHDVLSDFAGFDVPAVVRTPERLVATLGAVDEIPPMLRGDVRRYVAFASDSIADEAGDVLAAWDRPGERAVVVGGDHVLIDLTVPSHEARLSNTRAEKLTGTTMTMRDIKVVRVLAEKWGGR